MYDRNKMTKERLDIATSLSKEIITLKKEIQDIESGKILVLMNGSTRIPVHIYKVFKENALKFLKDNLSEKLKEFEKA